MSPVFSAVEIAEHLFCLEFRDGVPHDRVERTQHLLREAVDADPETRLRLHDEIVLLNVEVAESIVMRYRNRGVAVDDLVQVACLGLVKAVRGFDPEKSDNFLGYAVPTILGEVKRFFRDNAWVVRPPRRIQELQAELSAVSAEIAHTTGRVPTPSAIAAAIGVDEKDVVEALAADGCFAPSSLDRTSDRTADDAPALTDVLGNDDPGYDRAEAVVALTPLCKELSERDQKIVYLRFFHEWTQARIAEEFGVTQMQISRLLTRILAQLRDRLGELDVAAETEASEPIRTARRSSPSTAPAPVTARAAMPRPRAASFRQAQDKRAQGQRASERSLTAVGASGGAALTQEAS